MEQGRSGPIRACIGKSLVSFKDSKMRLQKILGQSGSKMGKEMSETQISVGYIGEGKSWIWLTMRMQL